MNTIQKALIIIGIIIIILLLIYIKTAIAHDCHYGQSYNDRRHEWNMIEDNYWRQREHERQIDYDRSQQQIRNDIERLGQDLENNIHRRN